MKDRDAGSDPCSSEAERDGRSGKGSCNVFLAAVLRSASLFELGMAFQRKHRVLADRRYGDSQRSLSG